MLNGIFWENARGRLVRAVNGGADQFAVGRLFCDVSGGRVRWTCPVDVSGGRVEDIEWRGKDLWWRRERIGDGPG